MVSAALKATSRTRHELALARHARHRRPTMGQPRLLRQTAASPSAVTAAGWTATAATASQLRRPTDGRTTERHDKRHRAHVDSDPDGATSESLALTTIGTACADSGAAAASASLLDVATAASQAATAATADPSMRQLTVAESFQRATRRRTDDPGNTSSPPSDAPPPTTATPFDHPDPFPPPGPPPSLV